MVVSSRHQNGRANQNLEGMMMIIFQSKVEVVNYIDPCKHQRTAVVCAYDFAGLATDRVWLEKDLPQITNKPTCLDGVVDYSGQTTCCFRSMQGKEVHKAASYIGKN